MVLRGTIKFGAHLGVLTHIQVQDLTSQSTLF